METINAIGDYCKLVYTRFNKPVYTLRSDGFFHCVGKRKGILVKSWSLGTVMYHSPEDCL